MMRRLVAYILFFLTISQGVVAQNIVTDLSERSIDIRYSFNGANLLLFGAYEEAKFGNNESVDIIVVVRGPNEDIVVREKQKTYGIWVNRDVHVFTQAPGFYAVVSTKPMKDIASIAYLNAKGIGYQSLGLDQDNHVDHAEAFRSALVRGKEKNGLYMEDTAGVSIVGGGLFRSDIKLPANVPVGDFSIETFVFQNSKIVGHKNIMLKVDKAGFERTVYSYAHSHPFWYGITAVLIALLAGWFAGFVGRKQF